MLTWSLCRLSGGVAVIQVGAQTETELKEKKLRVEDALNATKVPSPLLPWCFEQENDAIHAIHCLWRKS